MLFLYFFSFYIAVIPDFENLQAIIYSLEAKRSGADIFINCKSKNSI